MKYTFISLAFAFAILCGCNQQQSPQAQRSELEQHVLAVHDTAMAKMDNIYHLRKSLRALRDTLQTQQTDSVALAGLQTQIQLLNSADEAMMGWMRQYTPPTEMKDEEALEYLQQQLLKIEKVQTLMDSTIQAARTTYNTYEERK